jgi:hypothetical protein
MTQSESQLKQDLRAVRALFSGPEKWTQHEFARSARGAPICPCDEGACQWCLAGAFQTLDDAYRINECRDVIWALLPDEALVCWNDDPARTFGDIVRLLDSAIEEAP